MKSLYEQTKEQAAKELRGAKTKFFWSNNKKTGQRNEKTMLPPGPDRKVHATGKTSVGYRVNRSERNALSQIR